MQLYARWVFKKLFQRPVIDCHPRGEGIGKNWIPTEKCLKKCCFKGSAICAPEGEGVGKECNYEREGLENNAHERVNNLLPRGGRDL